MIKKTLKILLMVCFILTISLSINKIIFSVSGDKSLSDKTLFVYNDGYFTYEQLDQLLNLEGLEYYSYSLKTGDYNSNLDVVIQNSELPKDVQKLFKKGTKIVSRNPNIMDMNYYDKEFFNDFKLKSGHLPKADNEIIVDNLTAEAYKLKTNKDILNTIVPLSSNTISSTVIKGEKEACQDNSTPRQTKNFKVVGVLDSKATNIKEEMYYNDFEYIPLIFVNTNLSKDLPTLNENQQTNARTDYIEENYIYKIPYQQWGNYYKEVKCSSSGDESNWARYVMPESLDDFKDKNIPTIQEANFNLDGIKLKFNSKASMLSAYDSIKSTNDNFKLSTKDKIYVKKTSILNKIAIILLIISTLIFTIVFRSYSTKKDGTLIKDILITTSIELILLILVSLFFNSHIILLASISVLIIVFILEILCNIKYLKQ